MCDWGCKGHDAGMWKDRGMMQKHCGWKSALSDYTETVMLRKIRAEFGTFY